MLRIRSGLTIALLALASCTEPCKIPIESELSESLPLNVGSRITYEATIGDSNVKVFQRPPWSERVLTFGATIGGRDSVLATESLEDLALRFQDIDASTFYLYMPRGLEADIVKDGFWLKLPFSIDTIIQHVTDTSEWGNEIDVTYKSYWVRDAMQTIDGKNYAVKHIQTDYSWDDRELNDLLVHEARRLTTNVQPELGIFTEQTTFGASGRPRSHIIVTKLEF
jgi:hypothetical protein